MRTLLAVAVTLTLATPLHAQGWIEPIRPGVGGGVVKLRTVVRVEIGGRADGIDADDRAGDVEVTDRIARVEVEEWFQNRGSGLAEGDYLYPLPGEAVFSDFSLFQGDQELRGETMRADRAREIYESIVRRRKDPALIELAGHGLVRARVFPIAPGQTRRITLRYTQLLERAGDALQFRYTAGGRSGLSRPVGREGGPRPAPGAATSPLTFTLVVDDGGRFRDPFSPTHELRVDRERGRLTVRPAGELAGDFALFLPFAERVVGLTVATHRPSGEDGYFMLTLSPGEAEGEAMPRDVAVVVDVSGSMSGSKIEEARQALHQILGSLDSRDRFRLIAYNSRVAVYRPEWIQATAAAREEAARWVDGLEAGGGTNIADALVEAFRLSSPESRLPIVVFLTDGLPTAGETNPERIAAEAERARGRARVFAFGVGYDVNTYLLDRLTAAGRGTTEYLEPDEDVETALATLAAKIRHPVLTDLALADAPVRLAEIYPSTLPDLFAGEELVLFGRYEAGGDDRRGTLRVSGRRAGRTERFATAATFPEHAPGNDFLPRLWASRKIGELMREIRLNGADPELIEAVRETALRYGILTEYTAYLVQEPMLAADRDGVRDPRRPGIDPPGIAPTPFDPRAAAVPQAASGRAAVRAAESARLRREASTAADLLALDEVVVTGVAAAPDTRAVAGRIFTLRDGVWTDARHREDARVVSIAPFSDAYFALLRQAPELADIFGAFERLLVAGERVSFRIAPDGEEALTAAEIERLVREFRGR